MTTSIFLGRDIRWIFDYLHKNSNAEKYMICPLLSLERLSFDEKEGRVTVRYDGLYANAYRGKVHQSEEAAGK